MRLATISEDCTGLPAASAAFLSSSALAAATERSFSTSSAGTSADDSVTAFNALGHDFGRLHRLGGSFGGLRVLLGLARCDRTLLLDQLGRHSGLRQRRRLHRGHVHRYVFCARPFALVLDQHADARAVQE